MKSIFVHLSFCQIPVSYELYYIDPYSECLKYIEFDKVSEFAIRFISAIMFFELEPVMSKLEMFV